MQFTELSFWVNQTRLAVKIPKVSLTKILRKKSRNIDSFDDLEIPSDWQNTLNKKRSLKRSSSSVSSFASSTSSSYSVSEFLQDLESKHQKINMDIFAPSVDKTSTPMSSHIVPLNRIRRKSKPMIVHDVSGIKIYEENIEEELRGKDDAVYENTEFFKKFETTDDETEDGYEIVVVRSRL